MGISGHLITGNKEQIKQYFVYDGSNRLTDIYEARQDAVQGTPCLRTTYTYVSTSTRIYKMKETDSTWDTTYDI